MGYRTYIGKIAKTEWEKITDLSKKELYKIHDENPEDGWVGPYDICKPLYEFGKYTEFDDGKYYTPFFRNNETQEYYNGDHDFHIVGKEYLELIIKHYSQKIKSYYSDMLKSFSDDNGRFDIKSLDTPENKKGVMECIGHCRDLALEWGISGWFEDSLPYNLENGGSVTTSWKYEYSIFELVRLYKTFDWENDLLIYYGY